METSDDDFLTARWTGRGTGPRRLAASWRARLGVGVVGFVLLAPVSLALRSDTEVAEPPLGRSATAVVRPLVTTTTVPVTTTTTPTTTTTGPVTTTTSTVPPCPQRYEIRRGDSWYGLAEVTGASVGDLLVVNMARLTTVLLPGRTICLPEGARRPPAPTTTTTTTRAPRRTTSTSSTTPTTTLPVPPRASTDEVLRLIREVWPPELHNEAILIVQRESRLQSNVRNACCWGLFQIHFQAHRSWLAEYGVTDPVQLLDAATNVRMARVVYLRSNGWGPWGW